MLAENLIVTLVSSSATPWDNKPLNATALVTSCHAMKVPGYGSSTATAQAVQTILYQ